MIWAYCPSVNTTSLILSTGIVVQGTWLMLRSIWLFFHFCFLVFFLYFSIIPSAVSSTKDPVEPHWFAVDVLPWQVFLIQGSLGLDSTPWTPDSSLVELRLRIPIVSRILNFLCCIPDSKSQDSGFHNLNFPVSGFHTLKISLIPLYGAKF